MKKSIDKVIFEKRARGEYFITIDELREYFNTSYNSIKQSIFRYKKKGKLSQIRKGFYVITIPEYAKNKIIPVYLFIDDMMKWQKKDYYLGLLSAASMFGATQQQVMETYIIIKKPPIRNIKNEKLSINFIVKKDWNEKDIKKIKTDAGYINVSSPEMTILDLMYYMKNWGINRAANIVNEIAPKIDKKKLEIAAKRYNKKIAIQRLGYLFEKELNEREFANVLSHVMKDNKYNCALLSPHHSKKGKMISEWKIIKNTEIEIEI